MEERDTEGVVRSGCGGRRHYILQKQIPREGEEEQARREERRDEGGEEEEGQERRGSERWVVRSVAMLSPKCASIWHNSRACGTTARTLLLRFNARFLRMQRAEEYKGFENAGRIPRGVLSRAGVRHRLAGERKPARQPSPAEQRIRCSMSFNTRHPP